MFIDLFFSWHWTRGKQLFPTFSQAIPRQNKNKNKKGQPIGLNFSNIPSSWSWVLVAGFVYFIPRFDFNLPPICTCMTSPPTAPQYPNSTTLYSHIYCFYIPNPKPTSLLCYLDYISFGHYNGNSHIVVSLANSHGCCIGARPRH